MTFRRSWVFVVLAMIMTTVISGYSQSAGPLLEAARKAEVIDGDLKAAIAQYQTILDKFGRDRAVAAAALLRMGECYEKLGDSTSRSIYERVVRDYSDQKEAAAAARTRLGYSRQTGQAPVTLRSIRRGDASGTVSRDGRYLTFVNETGNLAVRDLRAGADRVLTTRVDYSIGQSAISHDNRLIAYRAYDGGCTGENRAAPALCVVSMAGDGIPAPRTLVQNPDIKEITPLDWSPDNRLIAVSLRRQDLAAQIGLVAVSDGSVRVLQSVDWRGPNRIFFSPDGRDIVFDLPVDDLTDNRDIFVLAADGSRGLPAVQHSSQDIVLGWTPDGSELLFASDRGGDMGLWTQSFTNRRPHGSPRQVRANIPGAWSLGVTQNGSLYLGVRVSNRDVVVTTIDPATATQVGNPTRPIQRYVGRNVMPEWSPDGKHLAYVSDRGYDPTNNTGRIIGIRTLSTGEVRELRPRLLYFGHINWSPDSSALLTGGTDLKGRSGVFRVDSRTGEISLIAPGTIGAYPKWSLDGKRVFYRKSADTSAKMVTIVERDLASGSERAIASGEFGIFSVSPDGQTIAALAGGVFVAAAHALVQIRIDNGETRELLRARAGEIIPVWTGLPWLPDGSGVLMRKRKPNELWIVPSDGSTPRKVHGDVTGWQFGPVGVISLHPDGRQIAATSGTVDHEVMALENFLLKANGARQ
jgi:Tol biopolymer transport system component